LLPRLTLHKKPFVTNPFTQTHADTLSFL
jgi:hypothetical protein